MHITFWLNVYSVIKLSILLCEGFSGLVGGLVSDYISPIYWLFLHVLYSLML